jgi:chloramphenicol-sensitive protein RarD
VNNNKLGLTYGLAAYIIWGLFPLYWPLLKPATSLEIVAHRSVWTAIFCLLVLAFSKQLISTFKLIRSSRNLITLIAASIMISINWLVYIWAVNHDHVTEAALGYYINPLINIALGVILLRERMRKLQWSAVAIASIGVLVLTIDYGRFPWIAFALATSWGTYGFLKKNLGLGALQGLGLETLVTVLPYFWYLTTIQGNFGHSTKLTILLAASGVVTAIPLLFFNGAANRLPYSTMGLLQYITPTLQFACGVWVFHEAMPIARWVGFFVIWIALICLAFDLFRSSDAVND